MVWRTVRSVFVEQARKYFEQVRKYNSLGALVGIHVHLSLELQWFGSRKTYARAIEQGVTRIGELEVEQKGTNCR